MGGWRRCGSWQGVLAGVAGAALVAAIAADSRNETVAAPVDGETGAAPLDGPTKVAICLVGALRTMVQPGVQDGFEAGVLQPLRSAGLKPVVFPVFSSQWPDTPQARNGEEHKVSQLRRAREWAQDAVLAALVPSRIGANLGNLNARWRGAQQMFANRQRCLDMARERGGPYRGAVYVRPDLGYLKAIPFKELISPGRDAAKTVFVPFSSDMRCIPRSGCPPRTDAAWTNGPNDQCSNCASTVHPHGPSFLPGKDPNQLFWTRSHERAGINDQMAFGSWEAMRVYLSMWDRLPTTVQRLEKRFCCNRGEHIQFPESWQYHDLVNFQKLRVEVPQGVSYYISGHGNQDKHHTARHDLNRMQPPSHAVRHAAHRRRLGTRAG